MQGAFANRGGGTAVLDRPTGNEDSKLDIALNQMGDLYVRAASDYGEALEKLPEYSRPIAVMKAVKRDVEIAKTANFLLANGVAEKQVKAYVEKAISPTRTAWGHGPTGLFAQPMDPNLINAMVLPVGGLDSMLPDVPTNEEYPLYGIITGQTAGSGSARSNSCSPWGVAGLTKLCRQISTLGTVGIATDPIGMERLGRRVDRSDFLDYRLIGDPVPGTDKINLPTMPGINQTGSDFLNDELSKAFREAEVQAIRIFAPDLYTSNPGNAADAFHDSWFRGLDILVNTGYQDALTVPATLCAAADSLVLNFATISTGGNNITSTAAASSTIVDLTAELFYTQDYQAERMGLSPVQWAFMMTPGMFRELTAAWPCSYMTNRCLAASTSNPQFVEATEQVRMREEMRSGRFLWIDAKQVPVILDDTISETQGAGASAGVFTSTLYLLPLTVRGGFPVLFKTHFDFNAPGAAADAIRKLGNLSYGMGVSPDGKWLMNLEKTGTCFQISATKRPGLVLRTPFLAARITNVAYKPRLVVRNWNSGTSTAPSFYLNGGITGPVAAPSFFNPVSGQN